MKCKIEFASHPANLSNLRTFVRDFLAKCPFSDPEKDIMILGIDEACTNIIRYAYNHEECHLITLSCRKTKKGIRFKLRDFGAQSEPEKLTGRSLELIQPGGLGIHLIRRAFDKVDYVLRKRGTELILVKGFKPVKET